MRESAKPVLLDVTRLISRSWTGRQSTGIDRVCYAYLRHFRHRALAVIQHRGVIRVLDRKRSDHLFEMLLAPSAGFRRKLAGWLPKVLLASKVETDLDGLVYLNVSHTDFDLARHFEWIEQHDLKPVYLVHDLIPILHPEMSRPHAVRRHRGRVSGAVRHAAQIIVASHAVERDLRGFAASQGLGDLPVVVAPIAGENLRADPCGSERQRNEPHFLCIGTIEPRKNHRLLIEVWTELVRRMGEAAPKLTLVGQRGPMTGEILDPIESSPPLASRVDLREKCSDAQLGALLGSANAVLFPSLAEGFGLPLVEALQAGTPVIASDIPVFREIGQGAATLLDPADREGWIEAVLDHAQRQLSLDKREARRAAFRAPEWSDHFAIVDAAIARHDLQSSAPCETSLAA